MVSLFKLAGKARYLTAYHVEYFGEVADSQAFQNIFDEGDDDGTLKFLTRRSSTYCFKDIFEGQ